MSLPTTSFVCPLFEHPVARLTQLLPQVVECQWRAGLRDAAAVQTIFEQLLRTCPRNGSSLLLIDERLASPFKEDAKQWLSERGLPLLTELPAYSRVAMIQAADVYTRLSSVPAQALSKSLRLPYQVFHNAAEAQTWLYQRRKG